MGTTSNTHCHWRSSTSSSSSYSFIKALALSAILCTTLLPSTSLAELPSCARARCNHCRLKFISLMCPVTCAPCNSGSSSPGAAAVVAPMGHHQPQQQPQQHSQQATSLEAAIPPRPVAASADASPSSPSPSSSHNRVPLPQAAALPLPPSPPPSSQPNHPHHALPPAASSSWLSPQPQSHPSSSHWQQQGVQQPAGTAHQPQPVNSGHAGQVGHIVGAAARAAPVAHQLPVVVIDSSQQQQSQFGSGGQLVAGLAGGVGEHVVAAHQITAQAPPQQVAPQQQQPHQRHNGAYPQAPQTNYQAPIAVLGGFAPQQQQPQFPVSQLLSPFPHQQQQQQQQQAQQQSPAYYTYYYVQPQQTAGAQQVQPHQQPANQYQAAQEVVHARQPAYLSAPFPQQPQQQQYSSPPAYQQPPPPQQPPPQVVAEQSRPRQIYNVGPSPPAASATLPIAGLGPSYHVMGMPPHQGHSHAQFKPQPQTPPPQQQIPPPLSAQQQLRPPAPPPPSPPPPQFLPSKTTISVEEKTGEGAAYTAGTCPKQPNWEPCLPKDVANQRFRTCCQMLVEGCSSLCSYDSTLANIQLAVLTGRCPISQVKEMMICASGYEDATECCRSFGVFEAGFEHCQPYCNPAGGLPSAQGPMLAEKYRCLAKLPQIQRCFYLVQKP